MQLNASSKICNFMLLIFCCSFNPFSVLLFRERERVKERETHTVRQIQTERETGRALLKCEKQTSKQTCKIRLQCPYSYTTCQYHTAM